jgi:CPA2 family monovalent cation:H+ antiporter-2
LLTVLPIVAVVQPFLHAANGAVLLLLMVVIFGFGFWRTATDLEGHVRAGGQMVAELLASQTSDAKSADEPLSTLEKALPGFGGPIAVRLEKSSCAVGKNLIQLNLRGQTGATVIAIARGDWGFLPTGKETLQEGDVLALAGTLDATAAARQLLTT